jgi:hypothetical protein
MRTCSTDTDCRDPVRSTCAATFFKQLYAGADEKTLHADNLYCLQEGCNATNTSCSPGESCLRKVVPAEQPGWLHDIPSRPATGGALSAQSLCLRAIPGRQPAVCIPAGFGVDRHRLPGWQVPDDGGTGPTRTTT